MRHVKGNYGAQPQVEAAIVGTVCLILIIVLVVGAICS